MGKVGSDKDFHKNRLRDTRGIVYERRYIVKIESRGEDSRGYYWEEAGTGQKEEP
jgi:hypothetical protein